MIWAEIANVFSSNTLSHNHWLLRLSVTIQCLKQPILFCSVEPTKSISTSETEFLRRSIWCDYTTRLHSVCTSQVPDAMTTSQGHPIDSKTSTLTVGPQGPVLLQDFTFIDEMAHFDRERIPERVVHAKGAGRSVRCWVEWQYEQLCGI